MVRALTDSSLLPSILTTLIRGWFIAIPAGRQFMHGKARTLPSASWLSPVTAWPNTIPLTLVSRHLDSSRNHHVDDSVASNQRGLPQQLAATKFIQLAFLRLTKRWRACDLLTTTYPPRHMAVLLMMITRVWTRHHNLYMEISITFRQLSSRSQTYHLSEVSLLSHSPQRLSLHQRIDKDISTVE